MHPFEYVQARSVEEAVALLSAGRGHTHVIAGGTDLLSEIKEGVVQPRQVVSLAGIPELIGITQSDSGITIGAMTTIAEIAAQPTIRSDYTALAQAAASLATPQVRNVGTLGGNLNQRPRCWYYRHPLIRCLKKGGDRCYAIGGHTKYLCVTGGERCYIVHPSDTAVALMALGASVEIAGPSGRRKLPIQQFFLGPDQDVTRENVLASGEIVTHIQLPAPSFRGLPLRGPNGQATDTQGLPDPEPARGWQRSLYIKAREREAGDFALTSVAAGIECIGATIRHASVVLGGVAPVPYRAAQVEGYLTEKTISQVDAALAGSLALPDARPMAGNGYKLVLAANLVKRAVLDLLNL